MIGLAVPQKPSAVHGGACRMPRRCGVSRAALMLDVAFLLVLVGGAAWFVWRMDDVIHYRWHWGRVLEGLVYVTPQGEWHAGPLARGLAGTVRLSLWAMLAALLLGTVAGLLRTRRRLLARLLAGTYVDSVRNLPALVLIFVMYFFISSLVLPALGLEEAVRGLPPGGRAVVGWLFAPVEQLSAFLSAVVTLAIYEGAYISEIVRAGIESVPRGQWDASSSFGLGPVQQMRHVILPQALRHAVPPLAGQFISIIKDSAIVSVISVPELTFQGMELMAATYQTFEIWTTIALLYLVLTLGCSLVAERLERRFRWAL